MNSDGGSTVNLYNNDLGQNSDFVTGQSEDLCITNTGSYHHGANITDDPLLADPDNGDFHLQTTSPCIDVGCNTAPSIPATDFEGDNRTLDGDGDGIPVVDMGADELSCYILTVQTNGSGTVTSDDGGIDCPGDCHNIYDNGTVVTLTATPGNGFVFIGWGDNCSLCGDNQTCSVKMDSSKECSANFTAERELMVNIAGTGTVTSNDSGIYCPGECNNAYLDGTLVTLTATPASGFQFIGWDEDCTPCGNDLNCLITMNSNKDCSAIFTAQQCHLKYLRHPLASPSRQRMAAEQAALQA